MVYLHIYVRSISVNTPKQKLYLEDVWQFTHSFRILIFGPKPNTPALSSIRAIWSQIFRCSEEFFVFFSSYTLNLFLKHLLK